MTSPPSTVQSISPEMAPPPGSASHPALWFDLALFCFASLIAQLAPMQGAFVNVCRYFFIVVTGEGGPTGV